MSIWSPRPTLPPYRNKFETEEDFFNDPPDGSKVEESKTITDASPEEAEKAEKEMDAEFKKMDRFFEKMNEAFKEF